MGLNGGSRIRGGPWGLFIVGSLSAKHKGLCLFCRSDVVISKGGWLIGMKGWGSCTIRMMVVCFLCQMQVRVGENPQWVVCLHVYTPRKIVSFSTPRQTGLIFPLRSCIDLRNLIQSYLACSGADVLCV